MQKKLFAVLFILFPTSFMLAMEQKEQTKKVIALKYAHKKIEFQNKNHKDTRLTPDKSKQPTNLPSSYEMLSRSEYPMTFGLPIDDFDCDPGE